MKIITAFILGLTIAAHAQAPAKAAPKQPANPPIISTEAPIEAAAEGDSPDKIMSRFFAYLQRREVDQAYDQLTRGTKIAERAEDVKMLK